MTGAAWLQGAAINIPLILFSIPVSAWVMAILLINEVPDIEADGACGKNTLPVRFGLNSTANLYFAIHLVAALAIVVLTVKGNLPLLAPLVPLGLLALGWKAATGFRGGVEEREVVITYERDDGLFVGPARLTVPSSSRGYRTFTRTTWLRQPGTWTVSVSTPDGEVLGQAEFVLTSV